MNKPLVKALELAIKDLKWICHDHYTAPKDASRWGFEYAKRARAKYDEHMEAISILQDLKDKLEKI